MKRVKHLEGQIKTGAIILLNSFNNIIINQYVYECGYVYQVPINLYKKTNIETMDGHV